MGPIRLRTEEQADGVILDWLPLWGPVERLLGPVEFPAQSGEEVFPDLVYLT